MDETKMIVENFIRKYGKIGSNKVFIEFSLETQLLYWMYRNIRN